VSLRDALRDAIPYLDAAAARSSALSDEALSPRQIADTFRAWTGDDPLGVRDFSTVVDVSREDLAAAQERITVLETALRSLLAGAEHSHRMNQITAALDVGIEDARNALNPAQRTPNGS
jgi:hypothetical protein